MNRGSKVYFDVKGVYDDNFWGEKQNEFVC